MIKTSDEGTSYCTQCEAWAKENAELRHLIKIQDKEQRATERMWGKALREQHIVVDRLNAVAKAAEELTSANGFVEGTATFASLPRWMITRINYLNNALADLREGKP